MSALIMAFIHAVAAMGLAAVVLPAETFGGNRVRGLIVWALAAFLLFLMDNPFLVFFAIFAASLALAPGDMGKLAAFFILIAPAMPYWLATPIPFPGINYLLNIDYYKIISLAVLVPILLMARPAGTQPAAWSASDFCVILYLVYAAFFVGRADSLTSGLRFMLEQGLMVVIPYLAISRAVARPQDADACFRGFLVAAAILAAITLASTAKQWDFYRYKEPISAGSIPDFRGGFMRISATANTHSLGFHLAASVMVLEYVRTRVSFGFLRLWFLRAMLLGGMYFTGSRGSIAGLAVAIGVYMVLSAKSTGMRVVLVVLFAIGSAAGAMWLLSDDSAKYDPYGTFDYRRQLLTTSMDYIIDHPLFGDLNFIKSGRFDSLMQGQGIIDITNLYLLVALRFGLIGLTLFFLPFLLTAFRLAFAAEDIGGEGRKVRQMRNVVCSLIAGWLVMVATTSDVGLTVHLGLVLLALGHGLTQTRAVAHGTIQFGTPEPSPSRAG